MLLQTSACPSLSAAEAAVQCSVGTVEEIGDRHSKRQMAILWTISLEAVSCYRIVSSLIQHLLKLNAGLLREQSWHYGHSLQTFFLSLVFISNVPLLCVFTLTWLWFFGFCDAKKSLPVDWFIYIVWLKATLLPPPLLYSGVYIEYTQYVCGLSQCAYLCLSVPVGVVLFDSLIHSLLSLSLLSCL